MAIFGWPYFPKNKKDINNMVIGPTSPRQPAPEPMEPIKPKPVEPPPSEPKK